jgi:hypothetical protein
MSSVSSSEYERSESVESDTQPGTTSGSFDIYATYERFLQNEDVRPQIVFSIGNVPTLLVADIDTFGCYSCSD